MTVQPWPTPLPAWWWKFAAWCDGGRIPSERPTGLPWKIPSWAYDRYKVHRGQRAATPAADPYANLRVYQRVAFFISPSAGSPVGGAREIVRAAIAAGVTCQAWNTGDHAYADWLGWGGQPLPARAWARCDTGPRCATLKAGDIANVESPEIVNGFCTPAHSLELVSRSGAIITEATVPHGDWGSVLRAGVPVFIEIDPNVPKVREVGVQGLVDYGRSIVGAGSAVIPAFFCTRNAWWDGDQRTWATYWDQLREQWPAPRPFALYSAENCADWSVVK